jgi:hypothetical protein
MCQGGAANLILHPNYHASDMNKTHLWLRYIQKLILTYGRGDETSVVAYIYPVKGARVILRALFEHLTTLYLI